ncbi:MAG: ORC1-type DNA replication protein [Candidatus Bathyarchaeota archaeon]|nr:ORC1-type DNA replication protein [Candidatus Bathyarchaeota archaeon]MDH5732688.1 ORC1-type DNA replication protein [Candidatus Bathyarchaeota archaeon]
MTSHTNHTVLDNVFQRFLNGPSVFKDRDVLRHDYVPEKLPHREQQIRCFGEIVAPVLRGSRCSNVFIYGKTGTGKTAVVKFVLNTLVQRARQFGAIVKICYVNCRLIGTEYRILSNLCAALGAKVPFTGLAVGEVYERFKKTLNQRKILFIAVLDEIDALIHARGDVLLYELTRINGCLCSSKTSIVGISNDLRFKEFLDPRVLSSLSEEEIVFRPYDAAELRDILSDRAWLAFQKGALLEGSIDLCAALAAAEHGDARRALDLLRVAGEVAERKGESLVTEGHIRQAERRIEHDQTVEALKNLPLHSKLVLCSVYLLGKVKISSAITGDIYEIYRELCDLSGLSPLTQRRVSSLVNELDVIGLLNTRVVSMGRYGRTRKTRLSVARGLIREVFTSDGRLRGLVDHAPKCFSTISSSRGRRRLPL